MTARQLAEPCGRYSDRVLALFRTPAHAGAPAELPGVEVATATEGGAGARIEVSARVLDGRLADTRFRAFGCPHLVAAAEAAAAGLDGQPFDGALAIDVAALQSELRVPVEKTGRLLLLEDAFSELGRRLAGRTG